MIILFVIVFSYLLMIVYYYQMVSQFSPEAIRNKSHLVREDKRISRILAVKLCPQQCCITNHPKTQWLRHQSFIFHGSAFS